MLENGKTNLNEIKNIANMFLYLDLRPLDMGFVSHPFAQYSIHAAQVDGKVELFNLTSESELNAWRLATKKIINDITDPLDFLHIINKPYLPVFFKKINSFLSDRDFAEFLSETWIQTEFPNSDINVSKKDFVRFFKKANKEILMDPDEYQIYKDIPERIKVYRGLQKNAEVSALSWTLDRNVAEWFATRFHNQDPKIAEGWINKSAVLAYFDGRNEKEIVLDPKACKNISIQSI